MKMSGMRVDPSDPTEVFNFLSDPERFPDLARVRAQEYPIGPDSFFMMGDNSPRSKDSRAWDNGRCQVG